MWFLTIVLKNIVRRPLRSALTVVAIAVAVGTVVALVGIATGFEKSFLALYETAGVDIIVLRTGARQRLTSTLDLKMAEQIRGIPGVKEVWPGLAEVVSFQEQNLYGVAVQGWIPDSGIFRHLELIEGRGLYAPDRRRIMIGRILASNLDKKVGDKVEVLPGEEFEVVGIYRTSNVIEDGAIVMTLAEMQELFDRKGQVTGFSVLVDAGSPEQVKSVCEQIERLGSGVTALSAREHVGSISEIQMVKTFAWMTSLIALLIGGFGMMNTMVMSVHERTKEIGIFRALGWRQSRIVRLVLVEAVVLSLAGAVVGSLGAVALVQLLTRVPTVSGIIAGHFQPGLIGVGFLLAVALGLLCSALPAYRAANLLPTEALRHE